MTVVATHPLAQPLHSTHVLPFCSLERFFLGACDNVQWALFGHSPAHEQPPSRHSAAAGSLRHGPPLPPPTGQAKAKREAAKKDPHLAVIENRRHRAPFAVWPTAHALPAAVASKPPLGVETRISMGVTSRTSSRKTQLHPSPRCPTIEPR